MSDRTIVENFRDREGYRCGYCGSTDSNYSHGMWAHQLTCQDYQDLIDRGFRRSGKYCYKPDLNKMCCPCYPIRCEALHFRATKSQKKVLKRMTKYLTVPQAEGGRTIPCLLQQGNYHVPLQKTRPCIVKMLRMTGKVLTFITVCNYDECKCQITLDYGEMCGLREKSQITRFSTITPGKGPDPSKPPCRKAKDIRRQRRQQKKKNGVEEYRRFLCSSPLVVSAPHMGYGSFHQQYWLDGRIIAVGVLDILPSCISSVYLFYDPAYSHLSLGVYSALRETITLHTLCAQRRIAGFPLSSVGLNSTPTNTRDWIRLGRVIYPNFPSTDINKMLILYERQAMPYLIYRAIKQNEDDEGDDNDDTDEIQELADMVGPAVAQRMLLFRS
ncbi:predicted protein [Nematostella vectensis]|uniref:Arginyl-tRNA--protein transferase 1 n=1 Tax=Nematostella vectensis TaxID=45351 RepID=A7SRZ7_NEMVE|nr:predicted protein [Nematostella vectensis]|eukprot:XP_001625615.1 predicted protein [Nematostella vectensis]